MKKIFLLSKREANTLFNVDNQLRVAKVTDYATSKGAYLEVYESSEYYENGWLCFLPRL